MTRLRKTSTCLMLVTVIAVATQSARGASGPAATQATPALVYGSSGTATTTPSSATPARYSTGFFYGSADSSAMESVLVVPAREMDEETVARIAEDLHVMGRIIEKNALSPFVSADRASLPLLGRLRSGPGMGPEVLFGSVGRPKPLYLGGYGAAFFIQVDFPLLAPPEKAQEPSATPQEDRVWAETKRSLLEPGATSTTRPRSGPSVQPYRQDRVEGLKKALVATMKHATNIRGLEPGEWLTIVVQGFGPPARGDGQASGADAATPVGRHVMTLRAKKADVDSYAAGRLSDPQFEQRMQVITH